MSSSRPLVGTKPESVQLLPGKYRWYVKAKGLGVQVNSHGGISLGDRASSEWALIEGILQIRGPTSRHGAGDSKHGVA